MAGSQDETQAGAVSAWPRTLPGIPDCPSSDDEALASQTQPHGGAASQTQEDFEVDPVVNSQRDAASDDEPLAVEIWPQKQRIVKRWNFPAVRRIAAAPIVLADSPPADGGEVCSQPAASSHGQEGGASGDGCGQPERGDEGQPERGEEGQPERGGESTGGWSDL